MLSDRRRQRGQPEWFNGAQTVGITAGASAPEVLVEDVIDALAPARPGRGQRTDRPAGDHRVPLPPELTDGTAAGAGGRQGLDRRAAAGFAGE